MMGTQVSTRLVPGATYKLRCPTRVTSNGEMTSCMRMLGKIDGATGAVKIRSKRAGLHVILEVGTIVCDECGNELHWNKNRGDL